MPVSESECLFGKQNKDPVELAIVVPTYKRIEFLLQVIRSINCQKNPYEIDYKVIIVSNDPDFNVMDVSEYIDGAKYIVYRNKQNIGMCGNINQCYKLACASFVSYIQDDDFFTESYLSDVGRIIRSGIAEEYDCIIPNRYFLQECNRNRIYKMVYKIKKYLKNLILGSYLPRSEMISFSPEDCLKSLYPLYVGGPTCGITFNKKRLRDNVKFDENYPYVFDYLFFMNLDRNLKFALYDKYLSVYRTSDSASNRPEVQFDFFRGKYDYFNSNRKKLKYIDRNFDMLVKYSRDGYPDNVKNMIDEKYPKVKVCYIRYLFFRIKAFKYLLGKRGFRERYCPRRYETFSKEKI